MRIKIIGQIVILISFFGVDASNASEQRPLFRGSRSMAMGGAFTAVADDAQAIFINPAGLAEIDRVSLEVVGLHIGVSDEVVTSSEILNSALSNPSLSSVNTLLGKNFYLKGQASASFLAPGFAFAGIYDYQGAIRLRNQALPQGTVGLVNTYGGQLAFGKTILRFNRRRGHLNFGIAGKVLVRSGVYRDPSFTEILTLSPSTLTNSLQTASLGYGADLGFLARFPLNRKTTKLSLSLAMTDVGDTTFILGGVDPIKSNLTAGIALTYKARDMNLTLAYDYNRILEDTDWRKKQNLGLELAFPIFSLSIGMRQLQLTYGASLDLGLIQVWLASYSEEQGSGALQDPERRYSLTTSLKFDI